MAVLSAKDRDKLSDSEFGYVDAQGKGHFPLNDEAHVRDAIGRFPQAHFPDAECKAKTARKIRSRAKQYGIKIDPDSAVMKADEPLLVAGPGVMLDFGEHKRDEVHAGETIRLPFVQVGEWNFRDSYGPIEVTSTDLDQIVHNFERNARRQDLPLRVGALNEEHSEIPEGVDLDNYIGPGAIGWIQSMEREGDTVYADVELNRLGESLIRDDRYRGVSPELLLNWIDPETDEAWGKTAAGLALTTMPRMKGLSGQGKKIAANEGEVMACAEVLDFAYAAQTHIDQPLEDFSVEYAFPEKQRLPLNTPEGVKGAKARFQTVEATEDERDQAWDRICQAAKKYQVEVPASWRALKASEAIRMLRIEPVRRATSPRLHIGVMAADFAEKWDPDHDGDNDATPEGDTDHDYWTADGKPTAKCRAAMKAGTGPFAKSEENKSESKGANMGEQEAASPVAEEQAEAVKAAEKPATQPEGEDHEVRALLAAEKAERLAMAEKVRNLEAQIAARETADRLIKRNERIESLTRTGRITPAMRDKFSEHIAKFSEEDFDTMIAALELLPASSAVEFGERGNGLETPNESPDVIADRKAKAFMAEAAKQGRKVSYKEALIESNRLGYQG